MFWKFNGLKSLSHSVSHTLPLALALSLSLTANQRPSPLKCPRVTSVNQPLWMFITNSGLRILMWLYKCSALSCVISATRVMSCHIFTKWLKCRAVTIGVGSSLKCMIMGWHDGGRSGRAVQQTVIGQTLTTEVYFPPCL